ncbi:anti-sigma B factor antagonist [Luteimonas chenhongjianii]|uniref:Anti-sigma B factor antagonist n=1 Tax=Luteimonas chenhongjianii TaxID=2006110 RepID=A0A290XBT6_9GAMM|nr:STAS domain-containing protein [Luteimonas chenhongjianii]ATD66580.1 anti-sigma B factor antagonist [Luteimonas chenhongjianii]
MAGAAGSVRRDGDALVFAGAIDAASVPALWSQAQACRAGAARLDLGAVTALDSAGLALLAELAGDGALAVDGTPPGLAELCRAYRLTPTLAFVSA